MPNEYPVEIVADFACATGENALWHVEKQCLYWLDIPRGRIFRFDPRTNQAEQLYEGRVIGGAVFDSTGGLLLLLDRGGVAQWHSGQTLRLLQDDYPPERDNRFNDAIADPRGRVFCGTMSLKDSAGNVTRPGVLYRLGPAARPERLVGGVGTSNGMGFSPDRRYFYWTDTGAQIIWRFDYDEASGTIANQQPLVEVPRREGEGRPDGLTVDSQGNLWSARWEGGCVVCYSPEGDELERIMLPTAKVTCPAFGGPELSDLYITTAGGDNRSANGPAAGALLRVRTRHRGLPEFKARVDLLS